MTTTPRSRGTEILRGLGALLLFGILLIGFPIGLHAVAGSPIPDRLPTWDELTATLMSPDTDQRLFLGAVRLLGWTAWLVFALATCNETIGHLAGRPTPSLPRPARPLQLLVRDLVATATLAFSATAALTTPAAAHTPTGLHSPTTDATPLGSPHAPSPTQPEPINDTAHPNMADRDHGNGEPSFGHSRPNTGQNQQNDEQTYTVERDDTLWGIAHRTYGSGARYPAIFEASQNLDQPDGVPPLTHPDRVHPGQRLHLPPPPRPSQPRHDGRRTTTDTTRHVPPPPPKAKDASRPSKPPASQTTGTSPKTSAPAQVPAPVVAPPPERTTTPPSAPSTPHASNETDDASGLTLRSGSYIGLGLAAALSVALAATRLHRRRRTAPADTPPPPPVAQAHKAHLDTYTHHDDADHTPVPTDTDLLRNDHTTIAPDHLTIGTRAGNPVTVPLPGLCLALTGDGASATARALTTELLARASRDRAELLIPQPDVHTLYPGSNLTDSTVPLPGLTITTTTNAAITRLETEILRRARLLETSGEPDINALRAADPAEPLPTLLLTTTVPAYTAPALHALLQLGHRYGIGALILTPHPTPPTAAAPTSTTPITTTLHITADATLTNAQGPLAHTLTGTRPFHLTADDANGMLHTLHTATGVYPSGASPEQHDTDAPTPATNTQTTDARVPHPGHDLKVAPLPPSPRSTAKERPVRLQLLGTVELRTAEGPINTGLRRSARELLAHLALHPSGSTRDHCIDALWPEHRPDAAGALLQAAISSTRKVLRTTTGLSEAMFIVRASTRYQIDPDLIDIDLEHLTHALAQARQAINDTQRLQLLQTLTTHYTGHFADDLTHEWAQAHREHLRRTTLNTLTDLARHIQDDHPENALHALEHAIAHDPYAEPLYRTIMQLQARLGHPDAVQRTYRLLTEHLTTLDAEPDTQTHQLFTTLQTGSTH